MIILVIPKEAVLILQYYSCFRLYIRREKMKESNGAHLKVHTFTYFWYCRSIRVFQLRQSACCGRWVVEGDGRTLELEKELEKEKEGWGRVCLSLCLYL